MEATKPKSRDKKKQKDKEKKKKQELGNSSKTSLPNLRNQVDTVVHSETISTLEENEHTAKDNTNKDSLINVQTEESSPKGDRELTESKADVHIQTNVKDLVKPNQVEAKDQDQVEAKNQDQVEAKDQDQVEAEDQDQVEAKDQDQVEAKDQDQVEARDQDQVEAKDQDQVEAKYQDQVEAKDEFQVEAKDGFQVEAKDGFQVEAKDGFQVEAKDEDQVEPEDNVKPKDEDHRESKDEDRTELVGEESKVVEEASLAGNCEENNVKAFVEASCTDTTETSFDTSQHQEGEASCPKESDMPQSLVTPLYNLKERAEEEKSYLDKGVRQKLYPVAKEVEIEEEFDEIKPFSQEQILSLYRNAELERNSEFIDYFILYQKDPQNIEFYELLKCYLRARQNLTSSQRRKVELENHVSNHVAEVWQMVPQTVINKGPCSDGVFLTATHEFFRAQINDAALSLLNHSLQETKDHIQTTYSLHVYTSEVVRLQIEYFIFRLLNSATFKTIPFNAPVSAFQDHQIKENEKDELHVLRQCISDLFNFQRKPVIDTQFINDSRNWLSRLIAVLLRKATLSDHLFILNHILRCPAGISEWAIPFVQPPSPFSWSSNLYEVPSFGSALLDHVITTLGTIMLPVKARENFMMSIKKSVLGSDSKNDPSANIWVVVFDSEGEEDEDPETSWLQWHENDVVALLNQIPIGEMFRHVLLITKIGESDDYNASKSNEQSILKLISFSTHLLLLFNEGLKTFNSLRFKQLAKRVSRLIRHTVQYVSDHWECYKEYRSVGSLEPHEKAMLLRLQVEYDQFFLRATNVIFSSQRLGSWQFMAVLPYKCVSTQMMWRILWVLHNAHEENQKETAYIESTWNKQLQDDAVKKQFANNLETIGESEAYYLLTTFSNMAVARDSKDVDFVNAVSLEIFEIAFLNDRLRETLSREGRDLLALLCNKHPRLISVLLKNSVESMDQIGMMVLFLFREIPLHLWKPTAEDFEVISRCLLDNALNSPFNQLAKLLLTGLNWGFTPDGQNLFLNPNFHREVALLLVKACDRFAYDDGYLIYRSIQQVLFLAQSLRDNALTAATPQGFAAWAWDILLSLRLHSLDYSHPPWSLVLGGNVEQFFNMTEDIVIPSLDQDVQLQPLMKGLNEKKPVSTFVALMMTNVGHGTQNILDKGLSLWSDLVAKGVYYASAHALYFLLPFFYSNPEKLIQDERFIKDLQIVILADLTYTSVAKSLVVQEFPGKTLKFLAGTMLSMVKCAKQYTVEVGGQALKLWCILLLNILESGQKGLLAKWKGANHVFYLLDKLMETALIDDYLMDTLTIALSRLVKNPPTPNTGVVSSIFSAMTWSGSLAEWPSLIPSSTLPSFPWLFWFILSAETFHSQMDLLWKNTLKELSKDYNLTPDVALKKSASSMKLMCPKLETLPIYRWARNSMETDVNHPSLPLLWQRFFSLYLQRTESVGNQQRGSVGFKFFDGDYYLPLVKKMKKRLIESVDKFAELYQENLMELVKIENDNEDDFDEIEKQKRCSSLLKDKDLYNKLTRIYRAFSLWIGEPRLHDMNLNLSVLPPQYCSDRLNDIIQFQKKPWLDLLDVEAIKNEICDIETFWYSRRRVIVVSLRYGDKEETRPEKRILARLQTYEESVPPPQLQTLQPVVLEASLEIVNNRTLFLESAQSGCRTICEQACAFSNRLSKHTALDTEYLDLIRLLYTNINAQKVKHIYCHKNKSEGCQGPAPICLKFKEAHMSQTTNNDLDVNRMSYNKLINESIEPPPRNVCCAVVYVENCVTVLVKAYRQHGLEQAASKNRLREMGLTLFHHLMSLVGEATNCYPPTRQFLSSSLEVLGQEFVYGQEDQCMPLIKAVVSRPWLAGLVAPLFSPSKVSAETYIQLYQYLVKELTPESGHTVFVLLSKFDLSGWLKSNSTTVFERSTLLQSIEKALTVLGKSPEDNLLMVFDVYRNHLKLLLEHKFPEMYGHYLKLIVKGTNEQWLSVVIWEDFFKSLGAHPIPTSFEREVTKEWLFTYSTSVFALTQEQLEETMEILTSFFKKARDQHKTQLLRNFDYYLESLSLFMGIISHCFTYSAISSANSNTNALENKCDLVWDRIRNLFRWCIEPLKTPTILAWEIYGCRSSLIMDIFINCLSFLHNSLGEAGNKLLTKLLKHYDSVYCEVFSKDNKDSYVIGSFQNGLECLEWEKFVPNLTDLKILNDLSKRPDPTDSFLVRIFPRIRWEVGVEIVLASLNLEEVKNYIFLWALIAVNLRRENDTEICVHRNAIAPLLEKMETLAPWHIISSEEVKNLLDVTKRRCDPKEFVFQEKPDELETFLPKFLRHLCGLSPPPSYSQMPVTKEWKAPFPIKDTHGQEKRCLYIAFHTSLLMNAAALKKGSFLSSSSEKFKLQIRFLLTTLESAVTTDEPAIQFDNATSLMSEFLGALGTSSPAPFQELVLGELVSWWQTYSGSLLLLPCILAACKTLPFVRHVVILAEAGFTVLCNSVSDLSTPYGCWSHIIPILEIPFSRQEEFLSACVDNSAHFCQTAYMMRILPTCQSLAEELAFLQKALDWSCKIKPEEKFEPKVLLIWDKILELSVRQLDFGGDSKATERVLSNFTATLLTFGEDKVSMGLLGAIGFGKRSPYSIRMRFMCRVLATFVALQIPTNGDIRLRSNAPGHVRTLQEGRGRPSQLAQQAIGRLENLKSNKQYASLIDATEYCWKFVMDPNYSLRDGQSLVKELGNLFFPTTKYLCILNLKQTLTPNYIDA